MCCFMRLLLASCDVLQKTVTTPVASTWRYGPVPRVGGGSQDQPTSLSCDVGLLMASANRSKVESCSGGLELVLCPHYPIEPTRVRA